MSNNPVTNAFFFGRALAEVMSEKLEETFTNTMSDLGKFDAEQRENLRQFMEEVQSRAERASGTTVYPGSSNNSSSGTSPYVGFNIDTSSTNSDDLQTMLDQLRAEIATLRTELKKYR
jgi:methyl-accepting chemotaxis protein